MEPARSYFDEAPKLQAMPGATESSATFVISNEDHTLGNALRYVLMRDPATTFCGYSMPHPSEPLVNLRLQTTGAPADVVLRAGLNTLIEMCAHIGSEIDAARLPVEGGGGGGSGSGSGGGGAGAVVVTTGSGAGAASGKKAKASKGK